MLISILTGLYNRTEHFSLVFTSDGVGAYARVKVIKKKNRKRSHKGDKIGFGRIKTFPLSPDSSADDLVKTRFPRERFETPTWQTQCHVKRLYKSESDCDWLSSSASAFDFRQPS